MFSNFDRYDRILWRANGIIFLGLCLLSALLLGGMFFSSFSRHRPPADVIRVNEQTKKEEFLRLGGAQPLARTDYSLFSLGIDKRERGSFSGYRSKGEGYARNYLLFNRQTKKNYWIWPDNQSQFSSAMQVYDRVYPENTSRAEQKVVGLMLEKNDLGEDQSRQSLHYHDLQSGKTVVILEAAERNIQAIQSGAEEILVIHSSGGKSLFTVFNTKSLTASPATEIPIL